MAETPKDIIEALMMKVGSPQKPRLACRHCGKFAGNEGGLVKHEARCRANTGAPARCEGEAGAGVLRACAALTSSLLAALQGEEAAAEEELLALLARTRTEVVNIAKRTRQRDAKGARVPQRMPEWSIPLARVCSKDAWCRIGFDCSAVETFANKARRALCTQARHPTPRHPTATTPRPAAPRVSAHACSPANLQPWRAERASALQPVVPRP